jgi:transposase
LTAARHGANGRERESGGYAEQARKFRVFRGIDCLTGLSLVCKIRDYKRFGMADAFMSYLGLAPSSGE